ncbi:MAG TPA: GWxTD domain-containing protein [Acidobacteriota bacterium]|nr:GWxTD domain-containing protein [Acidobacteriota bacterium]
MAALQGSTFPPLHRILAAAACFCLVLSLVPAPALGQDERRRQEESTDYYKKWLQEDVYYIITDEERKVFQSLSTDEEKEQFIEQFWIRRDPDPRTAHNEFKEEHYRRIAFANERFASGIPGWMTDRGRIYIIHGAPAEIDSRPTGGTYTRPFHEGGGDTTTYPFEVWRYRHIEGIGSDIELEFVDPTNSGEYRLALNPEEKDALLHVPNAGLTTAEKLGLASKADRPYFSPGNRERYPLMGLRAKDNPFDRYRTYTQVQAPQSIKFKDLKELVEVNVSFADLPVRIGEDYYRLNEGQALVPITVQLENKDFTFEEKEGGYHEARLAVYGLVTSITNRVVAEFEDELGLAYPSHALAAALRNSATYQKIITLDQRMRYKLDLIVKDLKSGKTGVVRRGLNPPNYPEEDLALSSLVVSDKIQVLPEIPRENAMFVIGDVKIRPNLTGAFREGTRLNLYCQVYNAAFDQTTWEPSLRVSYQVLKDGDIIGEAVDEDGQSIQLASQRRIVLIKSLPVGGLEPGRYQLRLQVEDLIEGHRVEAEERFAIEPRPTSRSTSGSP